MKTIRDIWEKTVENYGELTAVRWLEKKEIKDITYTGVNELVLSTRNGLAEAGYNRHKHIALIGTSSVWWISSFFGITTGGNVAVPLDAGLPTEELIDLLNRSDSVAVFLDEKHSTMADTIRKECGQIKDIFILGKDNFAAATSHDVPAPQPTDIATIIYTSGTTGKSKGVMLSQENMAENVNSVEYEATPGCQVMSVLPIHHAYCLVMDWLKTLSLGCTICINDSFMHMVRNMGIFKPEVMLMVPLMIETIYKKVRVAEETALLDKFGTTEVSDLTKAAVRKVLYEKVFGGNLRTIFTGGAHLEPYYIEKFDEYGIGIYEGYGMSECSPVITNNTLDNNKPGSIGKPLKNVEIKFEDGEILVRGSSVMQGYYKMPEETAQVLKDGWLHTGDKGYLDEDGYLFINGRVKNLIIMSNGENVSPEEIENKLALNTLIQEIIVTGENNGLVARIFPDEDATKDMARDELENKLQQVIDDYNSNQPSYKQITGLVIRNTPFIRNATGKIKRQEATLENAAV